MAGNGEAHAVSSTAAGHGRPLVDAHGRQVSYIRLSVTDRCDLRCHYCLPEKPNFLPKSEILALEDLAFIAAVFSELGVDKIRVTGGEPLVRRNVGWLLGELAGLPGLRELVLTTNGTLLAKQAGELRDLGVRRINISLDTLDAGRFRELTRNGDHSLVLAGIKAASRAGFAGLKINTVMMRGFNDDEFGDLVEFAIDHDADISFIEEMPMGAIDHSRPASPYSAAELEDCLARRFELTPSSHSSGGPARYWDIAGHSSRVGVIAPHTRNFCAGCNRVRITCTGQLYPCLGHMGRVDLAAAARGRDRDGLERLIRQSLASKPQGHEFDMAAGTSVLRYMATTGG